MAARTFEDSAGAIWEVFEVRRASSNPGGVSAGLESGWLTFVNGTDKRRLAPFPVDWEQAPNAELERLCAKARVALKRDIGSGRPWPRTSSQPPPRPHEPSFPITSAMETLADGPGVPVRVEEAVRGFAHEARLTGMPAIEAMVRLKAMLLERFPGADHPARDTALVRRWFVDAFYFDRGEQADEVEGRR